MPQESDRITPTEAERAAMRDAITRAAAALDQPDLAG